MALKILGGIAKGIPLATPKSVSTRPTAVLIKRKLFDWRQHMDDFVFVDLCAGSGAIGFEALSRGAQKIFLNEMMKGAFLTLRDNKAKLEHVFKFEEGIINLTSLDAKIWIQKEMPYHLPDTQNVVLYLDPPYENHSLYFDLTAQLKKANFRGEIWLESDRLKGPSKDELIRQFHSVIKLVEQGDHFVVVGKLL